MRRAPERLPGQRRILKNCCCKPRSCSLGNEDKLFFAYIKSYECTQCHLHNVGPTLLLTSHAGARLPSTTMLKRGTRSYPSHLRWLWVSEVLCKFITDLSMVKNNTPIV